MAKGVLITEKEIRDILKKLKENPDREGLKDTPKRVSKHLKTYCNNKPDINITTFDSEGYDEIIILKDITFYSKCEHHLEPFYGEVHIGYLPKKRIVGISKLARIVENCATKLQIQERLTKEIADVIENLLKPRGVACVIMGVHLCMRSRGVKQQKAVMITSAMRGIFRKSIAARTEFLRLIGK